jgi:hypothetical protein
MFTKACCIVSLLLCLLAALPNGTAQKTISSPLVWFAPLDPLQRPVGYGGSPQYMDLFSPKAPWEHAAAHVQVFKIYPQWIGQASDEDLRRQFFELERRGIALALEAGPMSSPGICGRGVEGYGGRDLLNMAKRIQQDGGKLSYLAMDEPIFFGSLYSGHDACHWTPEQAVAAAVPNLKALLAEFPEVKIGDIEPLGDTPLETTLDVYRRGIERFQSALGVSLAFFHADLAWRLPAFPGNLVALRAMVESQHVPFGLIYNGNSNDFSDLLWLESAEAHMLAAEQAIGTPEHVIFQSWDPYPRKLFPENEQDAFTHLIDAYFRSRTHLTIAISGRELDGRLTTAKGEPISGANIDVELTQPSSNAAMGTLAALGSIPPGTTNVLFGIRVNTECGCSGPADLRVAEFRLQPQNGPSTVSSFQNTGGSLTWANMTDTKGVHVGALQNGLLHLAVRREQQVMINSSIAPEQAHGDFTFSVKASLSPGSTGSGYFAVFFMQGGHELSRTVIPFAPAPLPLGTATTRSDGSWSIKLPGQRGHAFTARARYPGSEKYWPSEFALAVPNL